MGLRWQLAEITFTHVLVHLALHPPRRTHGRLRISLPGNELSFYGFILHFLGEEMVHPVAGLFQPVLVLCVSCQQLLQSSAAIRSTLQSGLQLASLECSALSTTGCMSLFHQHDLRDVYTAPRTVPKK